VLDALTTLAFSYPEAPQRRERMEFFRGELEAACCSRARPASIRCR
jgi:membrane-bound lytic murein transglycosylase B